MKMSTAYACVFHNRANCK